MAEQHSSKGIMWATIGIAVVLIAIIYPLTNKSFNTIANSGTGSDEADIRIQPVAKFELAKAEAPAASGPRSGETIFNTVCGYCPRQGSASWNVRRMHWVPVRCVRAWAMTRQRGASGQWREFF